MPAVYFSDRYITDRFLPDKAIDVIDEAGSRARLSISTTPSEITRAREARSRRSSKEKEAAIQAQEFEKAAKFRDQEKELRAKLKELKQELERGHAATSRPRSTAMTSPTWSPR